MPKLDVRTIRMRAATAFAVQTLLDRAFCSSEKSALELVIRRARQKGQKTGFDDAEFCKAYQRYKDFKRSPHFHLFPPSENDEYRDETSA